MELKTKYSREEVQRMIDAVPFWGHRIPLPYELVTPGQRNLNNMKALKAMKLPDDLAGKRLLDIGTFDGFYAFEAEKRGAEVVAIDNCQRMQRPDEVAFQNVGNQGFETVKKILDSKVTYYDMDVMDLSPEKVGLFDITLFLGVIYHLQSPLKALENVARVTKELLIIETAWFWTLSRLPLLRYLGGGRVNHDPTSWFMFNTPALIFMLEDAGFKKVEVVYRMPPTPLQMARSLYHNSQAFWSTFWNSNLLNVGRIMLKAYK